VDFISLFKIRISFQNIHEEYMEIMPRMQQRYKRKSLPQPQFACAGFSKISPPLYAFF
jgi:hypothetical protein